MDDKDYYVYCALGDGECQEGEIWEAAQTANKYKLDNLIIFVEVSDFVGAFVTIKFETAGVKTLSLKFAPLTILN